MAVNPQLFPNGMPVPFVNELFVLTRDDVEFEVDKIPGVGEVKTKGTVYLSNIRMVFVSIKPVDNFIEFDMPLLYVHGEKFNQPIFFCNNISGHVDLVIPKNENRALYSTHSFKILFKKVMWILMIQQEFSCSSLVLNLNSGVEHTSQPAENLFGHVLILSVFGCTLFPK